MAFVYSCCFWFSLRLGGILIALFSISQAIACIVVFSIAHNQPGYTKDHITAWMNSMNLIYVKEYLLSIQANTEKYTSYSIIILSIYIAACLLYIYGAYMFNNVSMFPYILMELARLLLILLVMVTWLLVLKQNTMDIGLLIGASVVVGFGLLGLSYLWVCAANLPIVINEMEHEEKLATIHKLEKMLESVRPGFENMRFDNDYDQRLRSNLFVVPRNRINGPLAITRIDGQYSSNFRH